MDVFGHPRPAQIHLPYLRSFHSPRIRNGCRYTESHYSLVGMLGKEFGGGRVVVDTAGGVHAMVGVAVPASRTGKRTCDDCPYMIALIRFFVDTVPGHRGMGPVWSARGGNAASPSPASCRYLPCRFRIGRTCHGNDGTTSVEHPMKQRQTTIARPRDPPTPSRPRTRRRRAATPTI